MRDQGCEGGGAAESGAECCHFGDEGVLWV